VAAGKAAIGMAHALDERCGARLRAAVLTAATTAVPSPRWTAFPATHPRPSGASEAAGRAALDLADRCRAEHGLLVVCLSGGASAMLAVPAAGLSIADKSATTAVLLRAGLDIGSINMVRRHLSAIKGGQLAARAGRSVTLAISDVCTPVEDDPRVIGSGPTSGDDSTFGEALGIIREYGLSAAIPAAALRHLETGARVEAERLGVAAEALTDATRLETSRDRDIEPPSEATGPVPPDDPRLRSAAWWLIASRQDAMRAAAATAARLGYHVRTEPAPVVGEAHLAAARLVEIARDLPRPACLVASGETTVVVRGSGRGGRNQELAVAALEPLAGLGVPAALASLGTDGVDGPTDAAGGFVDHTLWTALGPDARSTASRALAENDSYPLLERLGALVRIGPTGTNVGDLQVVLIEAGSGAAGPRG
jgi:hydroxypyruvate reductase